MVEEACMDQNNQSNLFIGVLALQGAFHEHIDMLALIPNVVGVEVRLPQHLIGLQGIIIPGGESTTIANVARKWNLIEPLRAWVKNGKPTWGTCAGLILLANDVDNQKKGGQELIGGMNIKVQRNYFGSQISSFEELIEGPPGYQDAPYNALFIRAPIIDDYGDDVVILSYSNHNESKRIPVAAQQGNILVTAFHPELTKDIRWHQFFVEKCKP